MPSDLLLDKYVNTVTRLSLDEFIHTVAPPWRQAATRSLSTYLARFSLFTLPLLPFCFPLPPTPIPLL